MALDQRVGRRWSNERASRIITLVETDEEPETMGERKGRKEETCRSIFRQRRLTEVGDVGGTRCLHSFFPLSWLERSRLYQLCCLGHRSLTDKVEGEVVEEAELDLDRPKQRPTTTHPQAHPNKSCQSMLCPKATDSCTLDE